MRELSSAGQQAVADIAQRHGFSVDAVTHMLQAVVNGHGGMAQFSHPEFAGSGQWMRGGMTMVSDMFNNHLKGRVDSLCAELADLVNRQPGLLHGGSFQSQSQGGYGQQQQSGGYGPPGGLSGQSSLFVPAASGNSQGDWWPDDLRWPNSTGAQNNVRYAYFAQAHRLAIDLGGRVTVYDTLDHDIGGFGQQQSGSGSLSFNSQYGLVDVATLPVVWSSDGGASPAPGPSYAPPPAEASNAAAYTPAYAAAYTPATPPPPAWSSSAAPAPSPESTDVFATLERLADLRAKGIVSDEEFAAKKAELLKRL